MGRFNRSFLRVEMRASVFAVRLKAFVQTISAVCVSPLAIIPSRDAEFHRSISDAAYVVKKARINDIILSYVEGPKNGPPLVLLHAQLLDWFSYSRVLPALAESFHVFVIDYPGHGNTELPPDYSMTAERIGSDLGDFIKHNIGQAVFVSGNSSGGLLATWLAAYRPQLIRAAVLEDPPLFSSMYPRIKETIAYRAFKTSYAAVTRDYPKDFLLYWIKSNALFFKKRIGPGISFILTQAIRAHRRLASGQPVEIALVKNDTVRLMLRGLDQYDPRFGAAFYNGSWNLNFDHAEALQHITCPTLLMQAKASTLPDGTLVGAMSEAEAVKAVTLLKNGFHTRIDAGHVINLEEPDLFVAAVRDFCLKDVHVDTVII